MKQPFPLPYAVTKSQLVAMYNDQMSKKDIIDYINAIMIENRKNQILYKDKSPEQIKQKIIVQHAELIKFIKDFGMPCGYY